MKMTLLALTQAVLSSIDGDEINSIDDTVESQQVVALIHRCYGNIAESADLPEQYTLFSLLASGDDAIPTVMTLPTDIAKNLQWVKYDKQTADDTDTDFQSVAFVSLEEFFNRMHSMKPSEDDSLVTFDQVVGGNTFSFTCMSDRGPSYYTTIDDSTLVFDAYDVAVDTTLQSSKTLCYGEAVLPWSAIDSYIIPIDDHQLLLNETIAWAWAELKQSVNSKAEREVRSQKVTLQRKKDAIDTRNNRELQTPNYGRK